MVEICFVVKSAYVPFVVEDNDLQVCFMSYEKLETFIFENCFLFLVKAHLYHHQVDLFSTNYNFALIQFSPDMGERHPVTWIIIVNPLKFSF